MGAIWTMLKDADNARTLAGSVSAKTPMTDLAVEIFRHVIVAGDPEDDVATLISGDVDQWITIGPMGLSSPSNHAILAPCSK